MTDAAIAPAYLTDDGVVFHCLVGCLNATAENINVLGVEFEYTGYT